MISARLALTTLIAGACLSPIRCIASEPEMLKLADAMTSAAQIGTLQAARLPAGSRELRIWPGSYMGTMLPESMLQVRIDSAGNVTGTLWLYYPSDVTWSNRKEEDQFSRTFRKKCAAVSEGRRVTTCKSKASSSTDWATLYRKLESLDVWTNPDQSELPGRDPVLDGVALIVETRSGESYRRYHFTNPGFRDHQAARNASEIMRAVGELRPAD
jgi:hypothetical protein